MTPRHCVVTGAGRGLGAAIATALVTRGARVTLMARTASEVHGVAQRLGDAALAVATDIGDAHGVQRAFATARDRFGPVDCLVNNAALLGPVALLSDSDELAWAGALRVNVIGAYLCLRAALRDMIPAGSGAVLGITSGAAQHTLAWHSAYGTSKAGFDQLHRAAQTDVIDTGIRIALFEPGGMDTAMMRAVREHDSPGVDALRDLHMTGALRPAERVAGAVAGLLVSGIEAGSYYRIDDLDSSWYRASPPQPEHAAASGAARRDPPATAGGEPPSQPPP